MLNKNLLLGCVIAALTACGGQGSLDLGPNNPDFGKEPPPPTEEPPVEKTYDWDFEDEAQVADWRTGSVLAVSGGGLGNDCDLDTTISKHFQSSALQITPTVGWKQDFEDLCAMGYLSQPRAMQGGKIQISVYLPSFYTNQNPWNAQADPNNIEDDRFNFGLQVLLEDSSGNRADAAAWKNVYDLLGSRFNASGFGFQQRTPDPTTGDVAGRWFDLSFSADSIVGADSGFDINALVGVGIRLVLRDTNTNLPWEDNAQYVFIDNVMLAPPGDGYVPPVVADPSQPPADFAFPVFVDGVMSGFNDGWGGWGGDYTWGEESIKIAFDGTGNSGFQIGGPSPAPDVSTYSNFHLSIFAPAGSGTTMLEVSLCDCDGANVEVEVFGGEWNDITIPVADFGDLSMSAIRVQYRGTDPLTYYFDNIGFDMITGGPGGEAPLSRGWEVQGDDLSVRYGAVSYSPTADNHQLYYSVNGPIDLSGATITFDITADQAYIDSGANIQPYVQEAFGNFDGHWSCWINNSDLRTAGGQYECVVGEGFTAAQGEQIRVGITAKPGANPVAGSLTITNVNIALAGDAADPTIPVSRAWEVQGDDLVVSYSQRVSYSPRADNHQLFYSIDGPVDLSGATIVFEIKADQAYIDSGANIQPYIQEAHGNFDGHWSCWVNNSDLAAEGTLYECVVGEGFEAAAGQQIRVGITAKPGANPVAGSISLTKVDVKLAINFLTVSKDWEVQGDDLSVRYGAASYSPTADNHQLFYSVNGPIDLSGATITFDITADQAYIDSGANIQPYVQEAFGNFDGHWSCWINNSDLRTAGGQYECVVGEGFTAAQGEQIRVGITAKPGANPVAGSLTITNVNIALAGDAADPTIPVSRAWEVQGDDLVVSYSQRVSYSPRADNHQLFYSIDGPVDLSGATIVFEIKADQAYIDSGANIQPYIQEAHGNFDGHWSCWINNTDLTADSAEYECLVGEGFEAAEDQQIRVGITAKPGANPVAGSISIISARYTLAP